VLNGVQWVFWAHVDFNGNAGETSGIRVGHAEQGAGVRPFGLLRRGQLITGRSHVKLVQFRATERGGSDLIDGQLDGRQQLAGVRIDFQDLRTKKDGAVRVEGSSSIPKGLRSSGKTKMA